MLIKKTIFTILFTTLFFSIFSLSIVYGGDILLENYGGATEGIENALQKDKASLALSEYINFIVKYSIGLLSIAAVVSIVYAGMLYISTEAFGKKSEAKSRIVNSIGALLLIFIAFIVFNQINPELLKVRFKPVKSSTDKAVDMNDMLAGFDKRLGITFNTTGRKKRLEMDG
jgi:hypothetical protein